MLGRKWAGDMVIDFYMFKQFHTTEGYDVEIIARPSCTWSLYIAPYPPLSLKIMDYGAYRFFSELFGERQITWTGDNRNPLRYGIDYAHLWYLEDNDDPCYKHPLKGVPEDIESDVALLNSRLQCFINNGWIASRSNFYAESDDEADARP